MPTPEPSEAEIAAFRNAWPWFDAMYEKWTGTNAVPPEPLEAACIEAIRRAAEETT